MVAEGGPVGAIARLVERRLAASELGATVALQIKQSL
jgi:hypothetical protein